MQLHISGDQLNQVLVSANSVEQEVLRFKDAHEVDGMGEDAFSSIGSDFNQDVRVKFSAMIEEFDDVIVSEIVAISLAGDGSYAPDELEELICSLEETSRGERMQMITSEPLIGSMIRNGMGCLGLLS